MASTAGSGSLRATLLVVAIPLLTCSGAAVASDWKLSPRLSLGERYSDNAYLRPKGLEKSDWITEVSPGISVQREGRRLKVDVDYSLLGYIYANDSDRSLARSNLVGQAKAELLQDWFYLDATARASQQLKDYVSGFGLGDGVGIQNTRQTYGYSLSPYLKHRFGSDATVELRVGRDEYRSTGGGGLSDSSTNRYRFSAVSGNNFFPLSWNLSIDRRETDYDSRIDTDSEQASAYARLQIRREFGLVGQAGLQKGNFPGATNRIRDFSYYGLGVYYTPGRRFFGELAYNYSDQGNFLSGSLTLQPTLRTTLNVSSTQRNFGRSYSLSANHRTRKASFGLVYQETLSSYDQLDVENLFDAWLCGTIYVFPVTPGSPVPSGCTKLSDTALAALFGPAAFKTVILDQTYLSKGLTGQFSYQLKRANVRFSLFDTRREYQETGAAGREDRTIGMQAAVSVRPGERTTLTLSSGISRLKVDDPATPANDREDDFWNIGFNLTRQFQPDVSGSLELRHQQRDSSLSNQDYTENAVAARLNMRF
ncbi:MAG: TIGR03016 family PEP-CTERM system-associated outer membrane protein [Thiobacillaceae bacterium]